MTRTVAIQVNPANVQNGSIESMVGTENYEHITDRHVKVFGKDAYEPETIYWDGENLNISKPKPLKDLYYEVDE
jgi:hypothetical protein